MTSAQPGERTLRSDAEQNRRNILAAAAEIFADQGLNASLEGIAAHARVGIGTLYRRFGDREGLIDVLFEQRIDAVAAIAEQALKHEDPWDGFKFFLGETSALHVADRGLREVMLNPGRGGQRAASARERIAPLAAQVLERARDDGRLRHDLDVFDIPVLQLMLGAVSDLARDAIPDLWQRFLTILLDGLVTSRTTPARLPRGPLDAERYATTTHRSSTT